MWTRPISWLERNRRQVRKPLHHPLPVHAAVRRHRRSRAGQGDLHRAARRAHAGRRSARASAARRALLRAPPRRRRAHVAAKADAARVPRRADGAPDRPRRERDRGRDRDVERRRDGAPPALSVADARDHPARGLRPRARPAPRRPSREPLEAPRLRRQPAHASAAARGSGAPRATEQFFNAVGPIKGFVDRRDEVDELLAAEIDERRSAGDEDSDDVLSMLLAARHEDGSPMSASELRDELMTLLVAGHETTASSLAWTFSRLAREPRVLAELRREVDSEDGGPYLTATINEVLRSRPVLPERDAALRREADHRRRLGLRARHQPGRRTPTSSTTTPRSTPTPTPSGPSASSTRSPAPTPGSPSAAAAAAASARASRSSR